MLVSTVSASFDDAASAVNFGGEMLGIVAFAASGALLAV
ncbi:MAG: trimeric intracellular cation channel family protein, partial [Gordonia sp.]|nr:trimeric intracellular cation channel family protein [Gordonia sp. (in: high G+C Gram-positive bacteria)]